MEFGHKRLAPLFKNFLQYDSDVFVFCMFESRGTQTLALACAARARADAEPIALGLGRRRTWALASALNSLADSGASPDRATARPAPGARQDLGLRARLL